MKIEHLALQVQDPVAVAEWYCKHLGFTIKRRMPGSPDAFFLADSTGQVMLEIYNNPKATVPDYRAMKPLQLHLAFVSENVDADRARLQTAGCEFVEEVRSAAGDHIVMLRDPWGFAIQFCRRATPMV